jgi:hypothetical protein
MESDSGLLVLASTLFNGMDMEDIESGQGITVKLGDVEMSGIGSGLTNQDIQDDQDD